MSPDLPYREKVIACERGGTFKYFLAADRVAAVWINLARVFGEPVHNTAFGTIEIVTPTLIVRSTLLRNPVTVFRKRGCTEADVRALHALLEFADG